MPFVEPFDARIDYWGMNARLFDVWACFRVGIPRVSGVERTTHAEYGEGLKFEFEIVDDEHKGMTALRYTSAEPSTRNAAGRMMADLAGRKPTNGLSVDLDQCVGQTYTIVVREGEGGRTRVESADLVKDESPF